MEERSTDTTQCHSPGSHRQHKLSVTCAYCYYFSTIIMIMVVVLKVTEDRIQSALGALGRNGMRLDAQEDSVAVTRSYRVRVAASPSTYSSYRHVNADKHFWRNALVRA